MKKNYNFLLSRANGFLRMPQPRKKNTARYIFFRKSLVLATWLFILSSATLFAQNGETCATAIDITQLASPLNGTTVGATDDQVTSCREWDTAPDMVYTIAVPHGYTLRIGLTASDYNSVHDIFFGGCQIEDRTLILCADTGIGETVWENTTGARQTIYWVQDGYDSESGTYTLAWHLTPPPECNIPTALTVSLTSFTLADLSWGTPVTGIATGYEYALTTIALPPASGTAVTTTAVADVAVTVNEVSYLHVRANCGANGYSEWVTYTFYSGVCRPAPQYVNGRGITNVAVGSIYNSTSAEAGNYADYTAQIVNVGQGNIQQVSITINSEYNADNVKIWADWNNDYDFDDEGEEIYMGVLASEPTSLIAGSFTVPANAELGNHRIRIGTAASWTTIEPCYEGIFGSFEDYTINVTLPTACALPVNPVAVVTESNLANLSWDAPSGTTPEGYEYTITTTTAIPAAGTPVTGTTVTGAALH